MTDDNLVYIGWTKSKKTGMIGAHCQMNDLDHAREWLESEEKKDVSSPNKTGEDSLNDINVIANAMQRAVDMTHAQSEMIDLTSFIRPSVLSNAFKKEVLPNVLKNGSPVEQNDKYELFSLDKTHLKNIRSARSKLTHLALGFSALPQAIFLGLIASFDSSISDAVKVMLKIAPERLISGKTTIPLSDLFRLSSIDEAVDYAIEKEVYELLRGSHQEQVKYIEDNFDIKIKDHWKRYPQFIETFERRNLIAHGEKFYTRLYVTKCKDAGYVFADDPVGKRVEVSRKYMHQALDLMLEFIILMLFQYWRKKFAKDSDKLFEFVNDLIYSLVMKKRPVVAEWIGSFVISLKGISISDSTLRMIIVNVASAYAHQGNFEKTTEILDSYDWGACQDHYRMCVSALKKDEFATSNFMISAANNKLVDRDSLREWHALDFVRDSKSFRENFETLFQENIYDNSEDKLETATELASDSE